MYVFLLYLAKAIAAAVISYAVGRAVSALTPDPPDINQQGPRLNDLKVQASNYGGAVPIVYGTIRLAGNMIWSKPILETSTTTSEESGGKFGGPSQTVNNTTYTYSQSFAIGLCEGVIVGIRKIWANGKLIYNVSATADDATLIASQQKALGITVYTGSESQAASPLIQADVGIANTPAYRGLAYVVFENLQLADYYNRTPNLEFEVVGAGSTANSSWVPRTMPVDADWQSTAYGNGVWVATCRTNNGTIGAYSYDAINWTQSVMPANANWFSVAFGNGVFVAVAAVYDKCAISYDGINWILKSMPINQWWVKVKFGDGVFVALCGFVELVCARSADGINWTQGALPVAAQWYDVAFGNAVWVAITAPPDFNPANAIAATSLDGLTWTQRTLPASTRWRRIAFGNGLFCATSSGTIGAVSVDGINWTQTVLPDGDWWSLAFGGGYFVILADNRSAGGYSSPDGVVWTARPLGADGWNDIAYGNNLFFAIATSGNAGATLILTTTLSPATIALSTIVADLCTRAGLLAGDIDVTQLTDLVDGYMITKQGAARAGIEPLMQAYYVDAIESDGKVKFVKRGGSIAVAIPEADLAAHQYGTEVPDQLTLDRTQELELPVEMAIQYMDKDADYQVGAQYARRLTSSSRQKTSFQVSMSLSASKAKQITDVLLYDAWTARTGFKLAIANKYAYLEPTDVVQVTKADRTYTARLIDKDEAAGIHNYTAVLEDLQVYSQNAVAASLPAPIATVTGVGLTRLHLLDIPLLRDQDNGVGFYAAASGYLAGWRGAQLYKSIDGGGSYAQYGDAFLTAATLGTASGVLGNFSSGNIFDETNTVSVVLGSGTLASTTELAVLNGANAAVLGSEIMQFKNAVLTGFQTYTLSGLLRGRFGTEWAMTTHVAGERFVFLSTSNMVSETAASSEIGLARKYKAATFGGLLADAIAVDFTHTGVELECLSPVLLGGGRDASGNITLNWTRRTRITGAWLDNADVPLGEAAESYTVRIYTTAAYTTVARTIAAVVQTAPYSAANQVTDFGGNQATVYFDVAQNSSIVGSGYFARSSG